MSDKDKYNGSYIKLGGNPAFWAVDDGKKRIVSGPAEMLEIGIRPIHTLKPSEFKKVPNAPKAKKAAAPKKDEAG